MVDSPNLEFTENYDSSSNSDERQDWGEATSASIFYGRTAELNTLEKWLVEDGCQLVTILGMGGMGKTTLSVKLAEQLQDKFDDVIWRSLRDAPPVQERLVDLIEFFSDEQKTEANLPENLDDLISELIHYLHQQHCLLVLDNWESLLHSDSSAGEHRPGYEGYGEFLKRIGEIDHQSCLLLTTREKPQEVAVLEEESRPVRSLRLSGFQEGEEQEIFKAKGLSGSQEDFAVLARRYGGNALALKVVATTIQDIFDGQTYKFLQQNTAVFGDICDLLDQHFERSQKLEQEL